MVKLLLGAVRDGTTEDTPRAQTERQGPVRLLLGSETHRPLLFVRPLAAPCCGTVFRPCHDGERCGLPDQTGLIRISRRDGAPTRPRATSASRDESQGDVRDQIEQEDAELEQQHAAVVDGVDLLGGQPEPSAGPMEAASAPGRTAPPTAQASRS